MFIMTELICLHRRKEVTKSYKICPLLYLICFDDLMVTEGAVTVILSLKCKSWKLWMGEILWERHRRLWQQRDDKMTLHLT